MGLNCPECGGEPVRIKVRYVCVRDHQWGEDVDRGAILDAQGIPSDSDTGKVSTEMKMPFGKHKGKPMSEVPIDYIEWALANLQDLREPLRTEMQNQIELKAGRGVSRAPQGKIEGRKFKY